MDGLVTMSAATSLAGRQPGLGHQGRDLSSGGSNLVGGTRQPQQPIPVLCSPTIVSSSCTPVAQHCSPQKESAASAASANGGATVFVAAVAARVPEVDLPASETACRATAQTAIGQRTTTTTTTTPQLLPAGHVVKIQINPSPGAESKPTTARLISAVRLNHEAEPELGLTINGDLVPSNGVVIHANGSGELTSRNIVNHNNNNKLVQLSKSSEESEEDALKGSAAAAAAAGRLTNGEASCVRISVRSGELSGSESSLEELRKDAMVQQPEPLNTAARPSSTAGFYYGSPLGSSTMLMSSGQCSPSETLDSGTCSDLDGTPPPLPKKKASSSTVTLRAEGTAGTSTTVTSGTTTGSRQQQQQQRHDRTGSLTSSGAEVDSDDNESSISCDSLNSAELGLLANHPGSIKFRVPRSLELRIPKQPEREDEAEDEEEDEEEEPEDEEEEEERLNSPPASSGTSTLSKASSTPRVRSPESRRSGLVHECTYEERRQRNCSPVSSGDAQRQSGKYVYEDDRFYKFHVNEREEVLKRAESAGKEQDKTREEDDESFAGYKILDREAIRSAKGTVRGVKNRVRAGIATFLQKPSAKNYKAKDAGKVVVYTTTMGIVRETYYRCVHVKQILRTHMVKYEERDMYMSTELQSELRERTGCNAIKVPQLFIDGQHIGDADAVERLNESGELRQMLKPYKSLDACNTCQACGGFRLLPCPVCNGSKKSLHRNVYTAEFVALKCMNCDEVGLVRCQHC